MYYDVTPKLAIIKATFLREHPTWTSKFSGFDITPYLYIPTQLPHYVSDGVYVLLKHLPSVSLLLPCPLRHTEARRHLVSHPIGSLHLSERPLAD